MKKVKFLSIIIVFLIICMFSSTIVLADDNQFMKIDLNKLTYTYNGVESSIVKYTQDDFSKFYGDYVVGNLPSLYITEFLFDGVSMVKAYDLDDFTEKGNDYEAETLKITAININRAGNYSFTGELTGGMIAVNTNNQKGEINILLNGVKIDTDSKKAPAIYVYNKDINYTDCKVTIKTASDTENYLEGGNLKKVSLLAKDELYNYENKYSGDVKTNFLNYSNYYGIYTNSQLSNILFASVTADKEDLADGDPYYYYKGSGAISSDIDLYFEGEGYLEVKSKNKEGIETKGNLEFAGGTGDYVISAKDDCLNTTTADSEIQNARNDLTINVKSLVAIVDNGEDTDEGDAIDSNGKLVINGGNIIAIAHPGQDAGLDSQKGTVINGGTILATGDMYDEISSESTQRYMVFAFNGSQEANSLITLLNSSDRVVFSYKPDRKYSYLIYSSDSLTDQDYYLYKDGSISGKENNGLYSEITNYCKGTQLGYSFTGIQGGFMGGGMPNGERPDGMPDGDTNSPPEMPNEERPDNMPNGMQDGRPEDKTSDNFKDMTPPDGFNGMDKRNEENKDIKTTAQKFTVNGIENTFSGVGILAGQETVSEAKDNGPMLIVCGIGIGIATVVIISVTAIVIKKTRKE